MLLKSTWSKDITLVILLIFNMKGGGVKVNINVHFWWHKIYTFKQEIWILGYQAHLQAILDIVILMRKKGFTSLSQIDDFIKKSTDKRQNLQDQIKLIKK
jgi:hypothetical protein